MDLLCRPGNRQDCIDAIFEFARQQDVKSKPWQAYINYPEALDYMLHCLTTDDASTIWRVGGYVVMYSVGRSWHGIDFLDEEVIVRVAGGGRIEDVLDFLEERATYEGVKLTGLGTAYHPRDADYAERLLSRGGHIGAHVIYKEVSHGISPTSSPPSPPGS